MALGYDMLAIDLDGTVLRSDGTVSDATVTALDRARGAGVRVVVCTGRGWVECRRILERIGQVDPVVVAGGSIVAEPASGRTLHRFSMHEEIVRDAVGAMHEDGHAALVLKDPQSAGYDYLVVHGAPRRELDPVTTWWFRSMGVRVRASDHLHEDEHPEHTVRVGCCAPASRLGALSAHLAAVAQGRGIVHHFPAVVAPKEAATAQGGERMHVLELFDADATKWSGISRLAGEWGIPASRIAAIGDEINDESMIRACGLGIAMGNAVARIRDAARRHTRTNDQDGVAWAVERMLAGEW